MKQTPVFDRLAALSDPIRARLLAALERHELSVGELHRALQLPQSTVSRHLRALADAGWVASREDGTSNRYRLAPEPDPAARKLWLAVRDEVAALAAVQRDAERVRGVLAARHTTSQKFFASSAGQWDRLRAGLFGDRVELFALLGLLDPSWTVADLGCGTGQLADAIAPFVARVIAVDESPAMLRAARARLSARGNVAVRPGTVEAPPLEPGEAHAAVLSLVLPYIADPAAALGAVRATLAPRGRALVLDLRPHDRADLREQMGHAWQGIAEAQLAAWASEAGFTSCRYVALPPQPAAKGPALFVATLH
ncbi:MAG TPA: metalloregulator ArsR/SmtB family transcription factor [Gemmatimonadaceae bacterium]|nr:metalloregulator ArsR/SmtB family transcription factor [Gemmatimonadaceae bacterium]